MSTNRGKHRSEERKRGTETVRLRHRQKEEKGNRDSQTET